jgi:hypothetical protein
MNHFTSLSKCLPGLIGVIEPDEDKPEHQLILDMRHRIIASMNKLLDDMGMPKNTEVTPEDRVRARMVPDIVAMHTSEMNVLCEALVAQFGEAGRKKIEDTINASSHHFCSKLRAEYPIKNS